ncbi:hypothetical protein DFP72DRAFT_865316 [Ephemerocybe angulata]|uniref:BZIP domain-containing protein n=1 Tax=Ephemerocybe angulata TaxID=980116 RepID=A0A8H6IKA3_9AGAR|nr:hypothetical protein DFP72DRAFT_865316 [Tulosesus angulatus]
MPKSNPNQDPSKGSHDDHARISDVALRKKKNADAQAAFRARRANYIATLEETVTSLESVVLQLQESCRESRTETQEWKQHYARVRLEFREREKYWRALWQSKKTGQGTDDVPPLAPPNSAALLQPNSMNLHVGQPHSQLPQYSDESMGYRNDDSCATTTFNGSEHSSYTTSPSIPLVEPDPTLSPEDAAGRLAKYGQYNYSVHALASPRDPRWSLQPLPGGGTMPGPDATHQHSQSPVYLESPSLTASEMAYAGRTFGVPEEQKVALHSVLDNAPFSFASDGRFDHRLTEASAPGSRSMSPLSSQPGPSSSTITPSFQFAPYTTDTTAQANDRRDFDFRRPSLSHGGEVTLHGGTADISSLSGLATSDAVRYRLDSRKSDSGPCQQQQRSTPLPGSISGLGSTNENGTSSHHHDDHAASSESDAASQSSRLRRRRGTLPSSRSPSPGPPSLSCTVAVIKAQAFGALRRTRARGKKSSEGAAKVAMDVLEARGIGIGVPTSSKRPRIDNESLAMET